MFIRDGANPQETGFALFYISQELPQTQRKGKGQEKMILIVGGAYQGKTEYARAWWSPTRIAADAKERDRKR